MSLAGPPRGKDDEDYFEMNQMNGNGSGNHAYGEAEDDVDSGEDEDDRALLSRQQSSDPGEGQQREETWPFIRGILAETVPALSLTTVGLTFTGELLENVAEWRAPTRVDELFILIPIVNNLKGNLEMNLASRLGTAANIGELDNRYTRQLMLFGSLNVLQVQALPVAAVAAILSFALGHFVSSTDEASAAPPRAASRWRRRPILPKPRPSSGQSGIQELVMLIATAMASASISALILGSFMCSLILLCRYFRRNPDNIAPPIASCLGDMLTLTILGLVSSVIVRVIETPLPIVMVVAMSVFGIMNVYMSLRNEYAKALIGSGWSPLFVAMVISSGTGMVLDNFVAQYEGYGLLAIVMAGVPGAVGSIYVSRISTSLHALGGKTDKLPKEERAFLTAAVLFAVTLPVVICFVLFIEFVGWVRLPFIFLTVFTFCFFFSVVASLALARALTLFLWKKDLDPDTYAMPIQSALMDLVAQLLLVTSFELARMFGADVSNKPST